MFAFKIWGKFACFRDPLGISQNITLPIPPKTTVCGMLAAVLGIDNYLNDDRFDDFKYSVISCAPILKKSFSQNYINDYTKFTKSHLNSLLKFDMQKTSLGLRDNKAPQKPINRELLIYPKYIVFIDRFKLEDEAIHNLKNRICKFSFYLGNSEFAGNFEFIEITKYEEKKFDEINIDSFVLQDDVKNIDFEEGILYSPISFASVLTPERSPASGVNLILSNKQIKARDIKIHEIVCVDEIYHCRFV